MKICPMRLNNEAGNSVRCIAGMCAFWVKGECAIVKIAKAISENIDDEDDG